MVAPQVETYQFQAETKQLLDIMIHSLYTTKEIFLRELISNASDALDRLGFESLTKPELTAEDSTKQIRLEVDRAERTLTVSDTGTRVRAYWALDPAHELRLPTDAAYAEAFRGLFVEAVSSPVRSPSQDR